jgi:urease
LKTDEFNIPGEFFIQQGSIVLHKHRNRALLKVTNNGDRPIQVCSWFFFFRFYKNSQYQVGSHYHFIETNPFLLFDRLLAYGKKLDIPSGTSIRFEPGETKTVTLVELGGSQIASGGNCIAQGPIRFPIPEEVIENITKKRFSHKVQDLLLQSGSLLPCEISRRKYAQAYGPTTEDKIRLADTHLIVEIEKDFTVYGDECVFGGGKVIREGMGQNSHVNDEEALDLVITNAIILDYTGIYKADIGIKNHFIVGIGKAGNPDCMDNVSSEMIIGVTTEVLAGEGLIVVAGGVDTHVHFICPQICTEVKIDF